MATFANMLSYLRKKSDLSQKELADNTGLTRSAIGMYETGKREPDFETLEIFADYFNVDMDYLLGKSDIENKAALLGFIDREGNENLKAKSQLPSNAIPFAPPSKYAPILGTIPAGYPCLANEEIEGYAPVDYPDAENYFWLRVCGDSMINAGIQTGDLVLIRMQSCADNGQIVACRVNGDESTLKRFSRQGDTIMLVPENAKYSPQLVPASDFENGLACIIGVAVEIKRSLL